MGEAQFISVSTPLGACCWGLSASPRDSWLIKSLLPGFDSENAMLSLLSLINTWAYGLENHLSDCWANGVVQNHPETFQQSRPNKKSLHSSHGILHRIICSCQSSPYQTTASSFRSPCHSIPIKRSTSPSPVFLLSQSCRRRHRNALEDIRPTLLLRPHLLIMRLRVRFQLLQIRIHELLAAIGADARRLRCLDWEAVRLDWCAGAFFIALAVLALDL